jgi:hypothetical protein
VMRFLCSAEVGWLLILDETVLLFLSTLWITSRQG